MTVPGAAAYNANSPRFRWIAWPFTKLPVVQR
jgi:hypothetical protein